MSRGPWVLVTDGSKRPCGQGRASLAAVRALAAGGYRPAVTVAGPMSLAAASRHCARRVPAPAVTEDGYLEAVQAELARHTYLTVQPASDSALLALGDTAASRLLDKTELERLAGSAGIPMPPSRVFGSTEELAAAADELHYPVVIKPTVHRYNPYRVDSPAELTSGMLGDGSVVVQQYVDAPITGVAGLVWNGDLVAAVHQRWLRIWKLDCGNAAAAETIAPDRGLEERLVAILEGYNGIFNAQFIGPYLLDIHPRVYGTHPLAVAAGVNLIALYCDLLQGKSVSRARARPGAFYRWIEGDIRHALSSVRTGRMSPLAAVAALRPRRGTAHSTESLRDPGPMLTRLRFGSSRVHMSDDARRAAGRVTAS
jgi:predicted ATP-grasp superfamily ATP-dependent carboligase